MIAPIEPGVDNWPSNQPACTAAVPAGGCEVVQLVYATTTTATGSNLGDYTDRLREVQLWSTPARTATQTSAVTAVRYAYDSKGQLSRGLGPADHPAAAEDRLQLRRLRPGDEAEHAGRAALDLHLRAGRQPVHRRQRRPA